MHTSVKLTGMFLLGVIVLSLFVYAAGVSTAGRSSSSLDAAVKADNVSVVAVRSNLTVSADTTATVDEDTQEVIRANALCEQKSTRRARIECRLDLAHTARVSLDNLNVTEESCRSVKNKSRCSLLYAQVRSCYDKEGRQKDQCFKRIAGFANNKVDEEKNPEAIKTYMVFVLYNLQEKVEERSAEGEINATDAAKLIDIIVDIKQKLMNGNSRTEIRLKLEELKTQWRITMQ